MEGGGEGVGDGEGGWGEEGEEEKGGGMHCASGALVSSGMRLGVKVRDAIATIETREQHRCTRAYIPNKAAGS